MDWLKHHNDDSFIIWRRQHVVQPSMKFHRDGGNWTISTELTLRWLEAVPGTPSENLDKGKNIQEGLKRDWETSWVFLL
jgi:hypothetical protein